MMPAHNKMVVGEAGDDSQTQKRIRYGGNDSKKDWSANQHILNIPHVGLDIKARFWDNSSANSQTWSVNPDSIAGVTRNER